MENNKIILSYCHNFNKIISTEFIDGDSLSNNLVNIYKNFIFHIDLNNGEEIREKLQQEILTLRVKKSNNVIRTIVEAIIEIYQQLELEKTRKIDISMWI